MLETETFSDYRPPDMDDEGESPARLIGFYWGLLRKYYWIILITSIVSVTAGYFWTRQQPRLFKTSSKIVFHQSQANVFGKNIERVDLIDPGGRWQFDQFWKTQKELLGSRWFGETVVNRLDLLKDDKFVPLESAGAPIDADARMRMAVGKVQGMSTVALQQDSRVAVVTVTSSDPKLAADVANAYANAYVDYIKEFQSGGLNQIINWFDDYVGTKRLELNSAQTSLHKYKRDKNILSISYEERQNLTAANMEAVNAQLNDVENDLAAAGSLAGQIDAMRNEGESPIGIAHFAGSDVLSAMLKRRGELAAELAEAQITFGPKHEKVRAANDQLNVIEASIDEEVSRTLSNVRNRVQFLKRQRRALQTRLDSLKEEAFDLNELGLEYSQMKDKAESLRQLYETILKRSEELDISSMFESNSIQVLEEAEVPGAPFSPNLPYNLGIAILVGLALGGGVIFLIAAFDTTVKSEEDVTRYTTAPVLGMLPEVDANTIKSLSGAPNALDMITAEAPKSSFAEGIKTLRTNLMFMAADKPPKLLLVTSPGPGEGKTLISSNMAIAMAQSGLRTVLVDNDLRRPRVHKALGISRDKAGLSDVIANEASLDDAIVETHVPNLFALPAGHIPPNPTELLHTKTFEKVMEDLSERFDRVILDSPPIGAVADALILSRSVDAVLLVLKYGQSRKEMLKRSIDQLEAIGAPLMGIVLNDIRKDAGGYGYSYYYYYRYNYDDRPDGKKSKKDKKNKLAS